MPLDPEAIADMVIQTVEMALGPTLQRLAAAEAQLKALGDVRDRVVAVETKTAMPVADPQVVDLSPLLERVAAAEARLGVLGDLRDRVVSMETKSAIHVPATVELRTPESDVALGDIRERVKSLETRVFDDGLTKAIAAVSERVAVVETRAPVPGPAGKDGLNGKDGADGLGFEDLSVDFDGDRTLALKFERGTVKKSFPVKLTYLRYQGVFTEGKTYEIGDVVTWAGSTWHANDVTDAKPGEGSKAWTLIVKRGRDGKDGATGPEGKPGRDLTKEPSWRPS
jgi:hypothetical protein